MNPSTAPQALAFVPAGADIQKRAFYLWQRAGCPVGRDLELRLPAREPVIHHVPTRPRLGKPRRRLAA